MPIGAAIGGAVIAGGATIGAGALGAGAQRDAAQTASDSALQSTMLNNELFRETRDQNLQIASPFYNNGLLAGNALTDLLLGSHNFNPAIVSNPTTPGGGTFPTSSGNGALSSYSGPSLPQIYAMKDDGIPGNYAAAMAAYNAANSSGALSSYRSATPSSYSTPESRGALTPAPTPVAGGTPTGGTATPAAGTGNGALSAWDQFRQGTNYQWRLGQGLGALNQSYAANGTFESGAADKARITFGQNFASNELSNYMNLLASQQAAGLSAAGAVMGVGTSYAGNVAAQNTSAANAAANAALANGQASAGMWGSVGQGVGQLGGALYQYGMAQQQPQMNWGGAYNAANNYDMYNLPPSQPAAYLPGGFG